MGSQVRIYFYKFEIPYKSAYTKKHSAKQEITLIHLGVRRHYWSNPGSRWRWSTTSLLCEESNSGSKVQVSIDREGCICLNLCCKTVVTIFQNPPSSCENRLSYIENTQKSLVGRKDDSLVHWTIWVWFAIRAERGDQIPTVSWLCCRVTN